MLKNGHVLSLEGSSDDAVAQSVGSAPCQFANNSDCYGDGLGAEVTTPSAAACCALCQKTPGCKTAVWLPNRDTKGGGHGTPTREKEGAELLLERTGRLRRKEERDIQTSL